MVLPHKAGVELVQDWTDAEEAKIRHKIDWHTVPLVTLLYILCVSLHRRLARSQ